MFGDPEKKKNPSKAFFTFESAKKAFVYYNKEKKEDIKLPLPAHLVILDELHTVSGFVEANRSGAYSNEVKHLKKEILNVKTFKPGVEIQGYWDDIKAECKSLGIKYCKSLYCLYRKPDGKYSIINIKLHGGANNAWIDSANGYKDANGKVTPRKFDVRSQVVLIKDEFEERKKGTNVYSIPVFEGVDMNDEFRDEAIKAVTEELKPYLNEYLSGSNE